MLLLYFGVMLCIIILDTSEAIVFRKEAVCKMVNVKTNFDTEIEVADIKM